MAVERPSKLAKDFLPLLKNRVVTMLVMIELILVLGILIVLFFTNVLALHPIISLLLISVSIGVSVIGDIAAYTMLIRPLQDVTAAIIHISGEPTITTPPNPNDQRYARNGLKDMFQTLYQLASRETPKPVAQTLNQSPIEAALNETVCGFVVMNSDRTIIYSNKAAPTSVTREGNTELSLLFPENNTLEQWLNDCEKNAVHAETTWTRIADKLPDEENRRMFDVFATYDKGTASEVVLTMIDRTKLYEVGEQELDFIAFAAHELRGPITVIRGYIDVLQDELADKLEDDQVELFHRLAVSANRLSGYINNILNTSRYDRRHLKVRLEESSLADIYDSIKDDMQLRASAQNRLLSVTIPETLPTIPADPASLSEVIGNLIDNAIKYSNEGGDIIVKAEQKGDTVELSVEDHGIGMPGSVVSNLFQKFYRSHRSRETVAGTGIGLYISKAIVESHGGDISVHSEDGHGSTFIVTLPTYASVADKLKAGDNSNESVIKQGDGWIKNHSTYKG
jgi:signal transduction histidine kinase